MAVVDSGSVLRPMRDGRESFSQLATPCWLWEGKTDGRGYPRRAADGRRDARVQRVLWQEVHGEVPDGFEVWHVCRNRLCVNPEHLSVRSASYREALYEVDEETGCWPWAGRMRGDYGEHREGATTVRAHRWMWEQTNGPIPPGRHLHHTCENKACVNPDHLVAVTPLEHGGLHSGGRKFRHSWRPDPDDAQMLFVRTRDGIRTARFVSEAA